MMWMNDAARRSLLESPATRFPTPAAAPTTSPFPTRTEEPTSEVDVHIQKFIEEGKQNAIRARQANEDAATVAPTVSFFPTTTPIPTSTPYPTASSTPTTSPFPTATVEPSTNPDDQAIGEPTYFPTATGYHTEEWVPTSSPRPTASATPTSSPFPSLSPYPTITWYPTASSTPTSTPLPSYMEPSSEPSSCDGTPPAAHTNTSTVTDPPSTAPSDGNAEQPTDGDAGISLGYSKTCEGVTEEKLTSSTATELVFTYTVESTADPNSEEAISEFLNELEIHLLDMASNDTLQCASDDVFDVQVFRLSYSDTEPASEASTCRPEHAKSRSCWIIQTRLFVSTDALSARVGKYAVLEDIQTQLNEENLVIRTFPQLTFTSYLGPEPVGNGGQPEHGPTGAPHHDPPKETSMAIIGSIIGVLAFVALLTLIVVFIHKRTSVSKLTDSGRSRETENLALHDDESEASSIEIIELLSKSKARLEDVPVSSSTEEDFERRFERVNLSDVDVVDQQNGSGLDDPRRKRSGGRPEAKKRSSQRRRQGGDSSSVGSSGSYSDMSVTGRKTKSAKEMAIEMVEKGQRSSKRPSPRRKLETFEDEPLPSRVEFTKSSRSGRLGSSEGGRRRGTASPPSLFGDPFEVPQGYGNGGKSRGRRRR